MTSFLLFLVGFMLCGFICCCIFVVIVWKTLRCEEICGFTVELKHNKFKSPYPTDSRIHYTPCYKSYGKYMGFDRDSEDFQTAAIETVEIFDEFLREKNIKVPSGDDFDRDEDNDAAIYGIEYSELVEKVDQTLRCVL